MSTGIRLLVERTGRTRIVVAGIAFAPTRYERRLDAVVLDESQIQRLERELGVKRRHCKDVFLAAEREARR